MTSKLRSASAIVLCCLCGTCSVGCSGKAPAATGGTGGVTTAETGGTAALSNGGTSALASTGGAQTTGGTSVANTGGTTVASTGGTPSSSGGTSSTSASTGGAHSTGGASGANTGGTGAAGGTSTTGLWSMGYYASWQPDMYPVASIEWSGMTHIAMAFYTPDASGKLTLMGGNPQLALDLVAAAHQHGVKAIASLGGADSAAAFKQATASGVISTFVNNLAALATNVGYDGFDVDWEPLDTADEPVAVDLANRLRTAVSGTTLTIPIGIININLGASLSNYASIAAAYDQLNIMSYGVSGAWGGWKSWHSSPIYQQDSATPVSIDSTVKLYLAANVPKRKLGIGIGFYGLCYSPPVTDPDQALNGATLVAGDGAISYANIMASYYSASARKWDSFARVPYLSFASAHAPDGCGYISYDDEQSIAEKASYVKSNGLGGVIQWELNEGFLPNAAAGQQNPLLVAIGQQFLK
jgi:chitinase